MTEKRYYTHKHLLKENEVHDKICHRFMSIDETVEHMNNEYWKYKQLKEENEQLKNKNEKLKRSGASLGVKNDGLILENYELRNEITKLCGFLTSKGYDNDDFTEWIVTQFNKKTDLKEFSE